MTIVAVSVPDTLLDVSFLLTAFIRSDEDQEDDTVLPNVAGELIVVCGRENYSILCVQTFSNSVYEEDFGDSPGEDSTTPATPEHEREYTCLAGTTVTVKNVKQTSSPDSDIKSRSSAHAAEDTVQDSHADAEP